MKKPELSDAIVLGAGIAGLSTADEFIQHGLNVTVIDKNECSAGASATPAALLNPATGRRAKMTWHIEECYLTALDLLNRVQTESDNLLFEENGILRPAHSKEIAKDFKKSPQKYKWPDDNWVTWLEPNELKNRYPNLKAQFGGLFIRNGITLLSRLFLDSYKKYLKDKGLTLLFNINYQLVNVNDIWIVKCNGQQIARSKIVVFAIGAGIKESNYWEDLPLNLVKGQVLSCTFDKKLSLKRSLSSRGYFAYLKSLPNQLVIGSTYEHQFENSKPDEKKSEQLFDRFLNIFIKEPPTLKYSNPWAGIRVSCNDHAPVIGSHKFFHGLYIISGLGSKGFLMGPYLSKLLVANIMNDKQIPNEVSSLRY